MTLVDKVITELSSRIGTRKCYYLTRENKGQVFFNRLKTNIDIVKVVDIPNTTIDDREVLLIYDNSFDDLKKTGIGSKLKKAAGVKFLLFIGLLVQEEELEDWNMIKHIRVDFQGTKDKERTHLQVWKRFRVWI